MSGTRIIIGDLAGIEDALASAVAAARAHDPLAPVTVLAGHTLLRPYLRRALARRGVPLLDVRLVLPDELAERLAREPSLEKPRLSRWAERLIVREVAAGARGYFGAIAGREGFTRALGRLFRELDRGGFTPASFAEAARSAAAALPASRAKLEEVARLYADYVYGGAGERDAATGARRRSAFVAPADVYAAADPSRFEGPLLIYGAWQLAELHVRLIERIAASADVTVFLPSFGGDADGAHAALRERLAPGGAAERLTASEATGPARLAHVLFHDPGPPLAEPAVALASAPDTVREVWEAARACLQWARDGVRFHEMAVVYRNGDTYRELIDEIFREAGIETYVHEGRLLAEHPLGRRVLALIDLAAGSAFARPKVMEFLTETELPPHALPEGVHASPSEWEAFTRDAGIIEDAAQWDERLQRLAEGRRARAADEDRPGLAAQADRIDVFRAFIAGFARALSARPEQATWAEHLAFLRGIAASFAKGTEKIIDALGDLAVLEQVRTPVSFEMFCRAVRDDLESRDASRVLGEPVRLFGRQGVAVLDATSLRHLRFRAVALLGLAERAWPPPPRPDALLLERERRAINGAGAGALPMKTEPDEESLTFLLATQAATERLRLSYARSIAGASGRHVASYFFRAAVDALEGRRVRFEKVESSTFVERLAAGRLAADDAAAAVSPAEYDRTLVHAYVSGAAGDEAVRALMEETPAFARATTARASRWSSALTPYDGCLAADDAIAAVRERSPFAHGESVSPSRLETYAECPYRYYLHYVLRVDPLEEPEAIERMDNLERGSLIHDILERFMREVCADDPPSPAARDRHIARLLEIAREEGRKAEERGVTGRPLVWRIDARQIEEDLVRWYAREAADTTGLRPLGFEVGFGPQYHPSGNGTDPLSSDDPLALRAGERVILLNGRIDRIDADSARTRFRVIDYKTGRHVTKVTLDGGASLQLPVYLHAASRLLGIPVERGVAQYFFMTSKGQYRRPEIGGDDVVRGADEFNQVLETIADGVEDGLFLPNPGKGAEHCKYCDYKDVCDARIERIMQRKDDAHAAAYVAMTEIE